MDMTMKPLWVLATAGGAVAGSIGDAPSMVGVTFHSSHEVCATTRTIHLTQRTLIARRSIACGYRYGLTAAGARRIVSRACGRCLAMVGEWDMVRDSVSLPLSDIRRAIGLVCLCQVRRFDRAPQRVGKGMGLAVLDAVEDNLVPLHEL
ncbi:MAG TPA: hypothetical protein VE197_17755, partial [Mycobacterium sp.]|nr:hypothetical protein [Mycobacterium sp.]